MFDTMTLTKAAGGFLGAFLILLLGKWAAEGIYGVGGHGSEQAYVIAVEEAEGGEAGAEEVPFAELMAAADPAGGERLFKACQACHKVDGSNGTGPYLNGVVDRDIAAVDGFGYSDALAGLDGAWDHEALSGFLADPKGYAPGTKMSYSGMKDAEDRADLIAWLATQGG